MILVEDATNAVVEYHRNEFVVVMKQQGPAKARATTLWISHVNGGLLG